MAGRVVLFGDVKERYEAERLLKERFPDIHVESAGRPWEFVERACEGGFEAAVLLRGPIVEHQARIDAVAALRRNGYLGRIIYCGAFLTDRHDAVAAGADYVVDPDRQTLETVVEAAMERPRVAADHPYLRALFVGEWAAVESFEEELPAEPPALLLVALSRHSSGGFWTALGRYLKAHPAVHCVLVEDDGGEEALADALASGAREQVSLAEDGLLRVLASGRKVLREAWFARVSRA